MLPLPARYPSNGRQAQQRPASPDNDQRVQTTNPNPTIQTATYNHGYIRTDTESKKKKHSPREFGISCERNHAVITGNTRLSCEDSSAKCSFKHILRNESCDSKPWVRRLCRVNSFIVFLSSWEKCLQIGNWGAHQLVRLFAGGLGMCSNNLQGRGCLIVLDSSPRPDYNRC